MDKHLQNEDLMNLCAYLDGSGDEKLCAEIMRHLEECPACSALANTLLKTISLYRETDEDVVMSADVRDRLFECLDMKDLA